MTIYIIPKHKSLQRDLSLSVTQRANINSVGYRSFPLHTVSTDTVSYTFVFFIRKPHSHQQQHHRLRFWQSVSVSIQSPFSLFACLDRCDLPLTHFDGGGRHSHLRSSMRSVCLQIEFELVPSSFRIRGVVMIGTNKPSKSDLRPSGPLPCNAQDFEKQTSTLSSTFAS